LEKTTSPMAELQGMIRRQSDANKLSRLWSPQNRPTEGRAALHPTDSGHRQQNIWETGPFSLP